MRYQEAIRRCHRIDDDDARLECEIRWTTHYNALSLQLEEARALADYNAFLLGLSESDPLADVNVDGAWDMLDFELWFERYQADVAATGG